MEGRTPQTHSGSAPDWYTRQLDLSNDRQVFAVPYLPEGATSWGPAPNIYHLILNSLLYWTTFVAEELIRFDPDHQIYFSFMVLVF